MRYPVGGGNDYGCGFAHGKEILRAPVADTEQNRANSFWAPLIGREVRIMDQPASDQCCTVWVAGCGFVEGVSVSRFDLASLRKCARDDAAPRTHGMMTDLGPLLDAYETARQTAQTPMVSTKVAIEDQEIVVAIIHPDLAERINKIMVVDPRSTA